MCVPTSIASVVNALTSVTNQAIQINEQSKEYKYRQQQAINNAKLAQEEALRQKQLGIEESRKEKIIGIQEANKVKAINSANGFDLDSQTNQFLFEDVLSDYDKNAQNIENNYNLKSNYYFSKANSYLNQADSYNASHKNYISKTFVNSLNDITQVSQHWYNNKKEDYYEYF